MKQFFKRNAGKLVILAGVVLSIAGVALNIWDGYAADAEMRGGNTALWFVLIAGIVVLAIGIGTLIIQSRGSSGRVDKEPDNALHTRTTTQERRNAS